MADFEIKQLPTELTLDEFKRIVAELNFILAEIGETQDDHESRIEALE